MLELWEGDVDCVVFLQTIEHVQDPDAVLARLRSLVGRGRRGVRLDAERADAGAGGRGALGQPVARPRVPRRGVPGAVRARTSARSSCSGCSTRASCARTRSRSSGSAGTGCTRRCASPSRSTTGSRRRSRSRDFALRLGRAGPRARLPRRAAPVSPGSPGRFCIVLHTHMPYVEGYGTWPFGEEWLWEAMATSYLPLLDVLDAAPERHAVAHAGAVRPARGARGRRALPRLPARRPRRDPPPRRRRGRGARARARARALRRRLRARPPSASRRAAATCSARFAPHAAWTSSATHAVLPLLATTAGAAPAARDRDRRAPPPLRDLARRPLAARVRLRAVARRGARGGGGARRLRRPHRRARLRRPGPAAPAAHGGRAAARADRPRDHRPRLAHERLPVARRLPQHAPLHRAPPHAVGGRRRAPTTPRARPRRCARDAERLRRPRSPRRLERGGLCVCALDTELLGHFWHEGVDWLGAVIEACDAAGVPLAGLDEALAGAARRGAGPGRPAADELGRAARPRDLERAGRGRARRGAPAAPSCGSLGATAAAPPSRRALRELLALQACDWAFGVSRETAGPYPRERAEGHAADLERALADPAGMSPSSRNLAPWLDLYNP